MLRQALRAAVLIGGSSMLLAACGGDDSSSDGPDEEAIRKTTVTALTTRDPEVKCTRVVTRGFVTAVYGDLATCRKAETPEADDKPPTGATVSNVQGDAERATGTVTVQGGDSDGATGQLTYVKEEGEWKVAELSVAFLRSQLTKGLAGAADDPDAGPLQDPKARDCIGKGLQGLDDPTFRQLAYDAIADKDPHREFLRVVTECTSETTDSQGVSLLRRQFESGVRESLKGDGATEQEVDCVVKQLRETISEDDITAQIRSGQRTSRELTTKAAEAIQACGGSQSG
ncbi:hypothetical protein [Conexibacter sp. SYSU D00693]|uniref:hypothetical protein n=1 Tax=Conexibacter sp. SYSU D00693 TaxID=2812560 RepID=UPI00196A8718|nr:hypothetical protein [Conexibacter sp. SYSU D00693]